MGPKSKNAGDGLLRRRAFCRAGGRTAIDGHNVRPDRYAAEMFDWWRRLSRAEVLAEPFPEAFRALIRAGVPLASVLTEAETTKLEALVRVFVSEKNFEAAGGLELTDEMRVVIAARACLLVLQRVALDSPLYSDLASIVIYPSTYRSHERKRDGYLVVEGDEARLGESWQRGVVVLSWDAVRAGGPNSADGHDVVLHEFAHQLDAEDGVMDGTPELDGSERYSAWSRIAGEEYAELRHAVERHKKTSIDPYGATNGPEFFAVLVEAFFEKPAQLAAKHAALYAELSAFFGFDPAARLREPSG
jgi:Mlc titration factor MtfA (ptsG expression regulator)